MSEMWRNNRDMKLFLATPSTLSGQGDFLKDMALNNDLYILESFFYINNFVTKHISLFKSFLLDSGAFTFMNTPQKIDYKQYARKFIDFINQNDIKHFFELDIDLLIGYEETLKLRKFIEQETNKRTIPVFHKTRGLKEWEKMCEEYNYVAIGTIGEYRTHPEILKHLLRIARKYKAKVHGLGFTSLTKLHEYDFYSVDSTSWNCGNRFGTVYKFTGTGLQVVHKPAGTRVKTYDVLKHNFNEWAKFQKYVDYNMNYRGYNV